MDTVNQHEYELHQDETRPFALVLFRDGKPTMWRLELDQRRALDIIQPNNRYTTDV